ncbi:MAG: DUF1801 domain-containing protein [Candidatus Altiarchaeota archaeon]|nr:DUF1801 domain-containing protein [Candidatus Altiarchaeota archaeon]
MSKEVEGYIEGQKSPQKEILKRVRAIILKTLPSCEEKMAWGVPVFAGGKFYIAAMKTRVHVGFAIGGLSEKEMGMFEGTGKTMRHIKIESLDGIDEKKLAELIEMVDKKAVCEPC